MKKMLLIFFKKPLKLIKTILENSGFQLASRWKHCCVDDQSSGVTSMVWWRAPRAECTCKWPSESLVWGHNGGRGNLPNLHHFNSNFLPCRVDGSKQIIKLFLHLSCLFVWHLATTKHNLRARHVLSDLVRANYGTSVVAECNAWSAGKSTKATQLQLCAPVTKVRKRGGRPQPPASEKPGITATLTERSQDPTASPIIVRWWHSDFKALPIIVRYDTVILKLHLLLYAMTQWF